MEAELKASKRGPGRFMIAVLGIIFLLLVSSWIWIDVKESFPALKKGFYSGKIFFSDTDTKPVLFFIEVQSPFDYYLAILAEDWQSGPVEVTTKTQYLGINESIHPLTILTASGEAVRLVGTKDANSDSFSGVVKEGRWQIQASWFLEPLPEVVTSQTVSAINLIHWVTLKNELMEMQSQELKLTEDFKLQRENIDKLSSIIFGNATSDDNEDKHYQWLIKNQISSAEDLKRLKAEVASLGKKAQLAREVGNMGKLVTLARKTSDRENRWVESIYQGAGFLMSPQEEAKLEEARLYSEIMKEIDEERMIINHLQRVRGGGSGYAY